MSKIVKNVSVMCFHDELCQVYNALMTSRGINAVHKEKVKTLKCVIDSSQNGKNI